MKGAKPVLLASAREVIDAAAPYVAKWEGYSSKAYWDVNHWRLGYGSDTEGPFGVNVTKESTTTPERALQNLELRLQEFYSQCVRDVGKANWDKLTLNQKIALVDICYNYGHVPVKVDPANPHDTAARILACAKHNGGVNKNRRRDESELYVK